MSIFIAFGLSFVRHRVARQLGQNIEAGSVLCLQSSLRCGLPRRPVTQDFLHVGISKNFSF
ncbi:MAG: hypothetical protein R3Y36_09060 [Spirochaetales bacterium]